ncbi:Catalase, mono-functional, heme-containing [Penicillium expansum]|uniref:Catalase, mono-functional, heme-containing n=1 Tax=Penicillium expansum TaxID=27334 RepID=A0A0A2JQ11_PENEN|nr:Catalase, mono-functional, heme-containing [Penicillium expansum]KAJ5511072.1 Catalase mono-functional heme-containing [Penicillium expansum]KGO45927.1 Catalase, mono-functional, heme-containing [Penicillium expansum]KGO54345.1 Catalase, mono-functional, heme-containing [Penicillium expansum]
MSADKYYTLAEGCPFASNSTAVLMRNREGGGLGLLQDTQLIETLAHFSRERIPERVVHAKAVGAYGEFEATADCSDLTSASFLNKIGKKTPVLLRVSTVGPESGSADTSRDVHGWGMKLYTDEGNQDWVFNNTPVFFIRDPIKFPSMNRSHKRHPQTHLPDANMFWDFHVGNPEGIHQLLVLFSDRGTPRSVRYLNSYSGHTYKFTKEDGSFKYIKIQMKTQQGIKNFTQEEATKIAGEDPDYMIRDMFEAIERKDYPSWDVFVQVMDPSEAESYRWNIFDMTKVWPHKDFPLRKIGKMTLNRNPGNYFTDIEQASFSPSTMVPGFAASADPVLQARLFAYPDAARYRLGVNYQQLPTNAAKVPVYCPFQRDGKMRFDDNYGGDPNYVNSSLQPTKFYPEVKGVNPESLSLHTEHEKWVGEVAAYSSRIKDDDFVQPSALWDVIGRDPGHQERTIDNLAGSISGVKSPRLRNEVYTLFSRVNQDLGNKVKQATEAAIKDRSVS